ncbi:C6 finger domain-containing protein [Colletotrichum truncatum]|uniref:C6 finger domain-containing protein n=1 Tax=Colletotrichum truncatum TaxID=5467 RepID=A0ACC3YRU4_COLTU|nr:C6 finger domain-containing protein [Colletotrichum truncatum]KAF6799356.1 C6 finger domain-containing protein [Colletotrichum truncatum]
MVRSRGGCSNCKRRKRKCDETRPDCRACQRRGIQCEGYNTPLKWTNGIASRGRFAGAAIPDISASSTASDQARFTTGMPSATGPPPPTTSSSESPQAEVMMRIGSDQKSGSSSALTESPGASNDPKRQLFKKFLYSGLHRLYTTESHIWLQSHFSAMADKSQAFFVVCTAIQAYLDDGFSVTAMEHVDHALQIFRAELEERHNSLDASTLSAGILVCTLCLLQARPWTMYLQLMAGLYRLDTTLDTLVPSADHDFATRHSIEVLSVMDLQTSVIGRSHTSMGVWRQLRKLQDSWEGGRLGGIEVVTGLPRSFLDILADIMDSERLEIEARLWAWPGEMGLHLQCILWDCWRYTAVLDARRLERLKRKKEAKEAPHADCSDGCAEGVPLSPPTELVMCRLMASIYSLFRAIEIPANHRLLVHNGLIYPMVIASLEVPLLAAHPDWKQLISDLRLSFLNKDSFHNMKMIDEVLDESWKEGTDTFDIDEAARCRGVELAVF